ncbi:MAG TPA: bifunctional pyridoxal kinase/hydroxymethylpyrimidine kinase, partial [Cupriavidus sp.]|nr:bifunctional pyridoxal kinase/hydroxymethylpyrimidine kinase [Cupriavidus sp.]
VEAVRELLLPLAHGLTPNDFELGHLSGRSADSVEQVVAAARSLLTDRVQWMVVTSAAP